MAAQLKITDGTTTLDLLTAKVDWQLLAGGWMPGRLPRRQIRRQSAHAEGSALVASEADNVIETFRASLRAASHDAVATLLQTLAALEESAINNHVTRWQKTPVYMISQTSAETAARYSLITTVDSLPKEGLQSYFFTQNKTLREVELTVEREPFWRSHVPGTLPTATTLSAPQAPTPQLDATEQYIANERGIFALTHIYNEDASGGPSYSANLIAAAVPFAYFPGTPAINDAVYFGSTTGPFRAFVMLIGTAGSFSATITWKIWTGAAWTSGRVKEDNAFPGALNTEKLIVVEDPTGWATTTVNGVTAYWVKAEITAFTSWATSPTQASQVVYNPRDVYISIASTQIKGDVPALGLLRYFRHASTTVPVGLLAAGIRTHGLTNFTSRLNAAGTQPTGWTVAYGTDTSSVADPDSPANARAACTFGTITLLSRVSWTCGTRSVCADFEGEYHAYLRCRQVTGSAGDVSVRLTVSAPTTMNLPTVKLKAVNVGVELVDLGSFSIFSPGITAIENATQTVQFNLYASALSSTPDLYIYDLVLIPTDELSIVCAGDIANGVSVNGVNNFIEMDAGIIRRGFTKHIEGEAINALEAGFETRGKLPYFPHDKAIQVHFLLAGYASSIWQAPSYLAGSLKTYAHQRWKHMRGSE